MKLHYLRAFIVLLAGLIALIINMLQGRNVTISLLIVLIVIVIFYFIATLLVEILQKGLEKNAKSDNSEIEDDEEDENDENDENDIENEETLDENIDEEDF